jgi:hypothetical protein
MNRIAGLEHSQLMLKDREACLGNRGAFIEPAALRAEVRVDVPIELVAAVETLFGPILGVAKLHSVT